MAGLLVVQLSMEPPRSELRDLALYLLLAGIATMTAGGAALRVAERRVRLSIQTRAFLAATVGNAVGLLNVLIVAQLMFVSTQHDLRLLVALLLFSGVVSAFFSLWVASSITARVRSIAAAIGELSAGRYETRLPPAAGAARGGDETAELATAVHGLAQRLRDAAQQRERLDRERRDLTAAISHDLRTPLSSMRAMVEALHDGVVEDPAEVRRYHGTMRREIDRLSRMIDDLFELAQLDAGALELTRHPVALDELAADVVDAMQARASRAGVALELDVRGQPPELPLDGARVERAVGNLVRNALEHADPGGAVRVTVSGTPTGAAATSGAMLEVSDDGPGIASDDLPRVWDRFYRGEKSRHRRDRGDGDGAGLGLAIVRGIVEAHGGSVRARSTPGAGATFTIQLPASVPTS